MKTSERIDILGRLQEGSCTDHDYQVLCSCIVSNVQPDWSSDDWKDTPMIVTQNETKDILNNAAAMVFARKTGHQLHWYYAVDCHDGKVINDVGLLTHLRVKLWGH